MWPMVLVPTLSCLMILNIQRTCDVAHTVAHCSIACTENGSDSMITLTTPQCSNSTVFSYSVGIDHPYLMSAISADFCEKNFQFVQGILYATMTSHSWFNS